MTPAEQARADVEAWLDSQKNIAGWFEWDSLVARLVPVYERAEAAEAVLRLYLATYADTQTHPTPTQEVAVVVAAREALVATAPGRATP